MVLRFDEQQGVLVITVLEKRLDAVAAPAFRAQMTERVAGRSVVVLDLGQVQFIDSSGLAALISVLKRLAPGGSLRLAGAASGVIALLQLTRLDRVFQCFPGVAQALAAP